MYIDQMLEGYPELLTVKQMQEILCVGKNKAYEIVKQNELTYMKIGSTIRIPKESLKKYILSVCYNENKVNDSSVLP